MPELENSFPSATGGPENITPPAAETSFFAKLKPKWPVALGAVGSIALFAAIIYAVYLYSRGQVSQLTPTPTVVLTPKPTVQLSPILTPAVTPEVTSLPTITPIPEEYVTKRYECLPYDARPGSDKKDGYMMLVYPESVTIEEGELNCEFFLNYKKGSLRIVYTVAESYLGSLNENYLSLKEENGITLVRNPLELITGHETKKQYYFTHYTKLLDDSECVANEFSPNLRAPCAMGYHPFVTQLGIFSVEISKDTTGTERDEIMKVFDEIAIKSSGGRY